MAEKFAEIIDFGGDAGERTVRDKYARADINVLMDALTKTASGNPITITDCAGGKARSLKTTIEAIQDLHGYDHPWVGGADINKLPLTTANIKLANGGASSWTGNKKTISGSEVEILEDADGNTLGIKIKNAPTSTLIVNLFTFTNELSGSYILNGCPANGGDSTYNITLFDGTTALRDKGSAVSFASTDFASDIQCFIRIQSGYAIPSDGLVFVPMIRQASVSTSTFRPYSNICPISGRTEARVDTENEDSSESAYATIQLGTTVYGAEVDFDTGVGTVKTVCPDLGGLTWTADATGVANKNRFYADLSPLAVVADSVNLTSISSQYTLLAPGGTYSANADGYTITAASKIYIYDESLSSATAADFKTAMSGVQVEYTLATPTTIQLTPEQLEMLKGYNRVSIENGSIELGYIAKLT